MGQMLGSHDPDSVIDRPDLNKCPDCECFFAQLNCPLCGKICPEEMRAGNRKPAKIKKSRKRGTGRVTFVEWYHSWWFIILMLFLFPIVGICLLVTSPHRKGAKIAFIAVAIAYTLVTTFGVGRLLNLFGMSDTYVDSSLTREEYIAACETVTPEQYYRGANGYTDKFVCLTLRVEKKITGYTDDYYDTVTYYLCRGTDGAQYELLLRDCRTDSAQNFVAGDLITVYGEGAGDITFDDVNYVTYSAPGIYAAYIESAN